MTEIFVAKIAQFPDGERRIVSHGGGEIGVFHWQGEFYAYENMGAAYHNKGNYQLAIEYYRKAVDYAPDYSTAYAKMGLSYEMLKDWGNAIAAYKKATELSPDVALFQLRLGLSYLQVNRQKEATEALLAAVNLDPRGQAGEEARRILNDVRKRP